MEKFLPETEHAENVRIQTTQVPLTLDQLRAHGVKESDELQLEYFFFTDSPFKATGLVLELKAMGYEVEHGRSEESEQIYIITGWSTPVRMTTEDLVRWCTEMCELGFRFDCEFDGWGTYPEEE